MKKQDNDIVYEYVLAQLQVALDHTRRGKRGAMAKIDKLGRELVKRNLLTQEQLDDISKY